MVNLYLIAKKPCDRIGFLWYILNKSETVHHPKPKGGVTMTDYSFMTIQESDGTPSRYAWPGGYEIAYYFTDGERCCYDCLLSSDVSEADECDESWFVMFQTVYWEGPTEFCAHCNKECESEYGDPEENDNE
jgi:hypothetical protein